MAERIPDDAVVVRGGRNLPADLRRGMNRAAGGDVVRTSGGSPYHATVVGLKPEDASRLLTPAIPNPAKKR